MKDNDEQAYRERLAHLILPESELESFLQGCMVCTRKVLEAGLTRFAPTIAVRVRNSKGEEQPLIIAQVAMNFNEWKEKSAVLRSVGKKIHEEKWFPVAFSLAAECWVSNKLGTEPRHDPARREAIMIAAGLLGTRRRAMAQLPVLRDGSNRLVPGDWTGITTEGVETALLDQLLVGFFGDQLVLGN